MSTTMSKMAVAVVIVGLGGAMSAMGGHGRELVAPSPAITQAASGSDMCAIAASFSANPVMANEMRRAAGCH